jgi:NADH dehydrogenase FAD-containing subunit
MTKRRDFLKYASAAAAAAGLNGIPFAKLASAQTIPTVPTNIGITGRVVVIGGGMAGTTVAKYLRLWGGTGLQVTLVERESAYTSSIMSNLVLTGQRTISSLQYSYANIASRYGVKLVTGDVLTIDPVGRTVTLAGGTKLPYDRLVIAPGIEFDYSGIPGLNNAAAQAKILHAWKAGPQTTALRNQITAMPTGGTFVMTIPAKPYRCPPGPYERACVVADWLKKNKATTTSKPKVIVLDANPGIIAEVNSFTDAFNNVHAGIIEYHPGVTITDVDATAMKLTTNIGPISGHVINFIPPQMAGKVITSNGLASAGGRWAGVNVLSYESNVAQRIHVIGDSSATTQPKAGHIANQEAKTCADAIVRLFRGVPVDQSPMTNSACYSPITMDTASWLTAVFAYDPATASMLAVPAGSGEAHARSAENFKEMGTWFNTLMSDTFA